MRAWGGPDLTQPRTLVLVLAVSGVQHTPLPLDGGQPNRTFTTSTAPVWDDIETLLVYEATDTIHSSS